MAGPDGAIVFFDGDCALCHGLVRFLLPRDPAGAFRFAALDSAAARAHLGPLAGLAGDTVVVKVGTEVFLRSDAVLELARRLPAPWRWLGAARALPRPWRDACYRWLARNRHRFGRRDRACLLPRPEDRRRFLDAP